MSTYQPINYDFHRMVIFTILAGAVISALGISITLAAKYLQLGFLVFNQRPDMLGNYVDSPLAYIFNMGLILAGVCTLLAMYGLQQLRLGYFGRYISLAGFVVGATIILMGIYPINFLEEHRLFSTAFLLATILLYFLSLCARINHKPLCPMPLFVVSLLGLICATALALMLNWNNFDFDPCLHEASSICAVSVIMWCQTHFIMLWCIVLALTINKLALKSYRESISTQLSASY
ncbi:DUF998 domain-containing protein [Shewanella sp. Isolate11]|uniref:DUF998 domain-containing protein n=1 Tax=Shewanella sp. Isolate11 TaxID=2908530 RepID=UPI001EFC7D2F|nr:DUF998 domain-containing protein [Shewanella sp. Isolate11]MCG9695651.1 DUF998 domain-containing protein [Shewanella sp. Isolate11]